MITPNTKDSPLQLILDFDQSAKSTLPNHLYILYIDLNIGTILYTVSYSVVVGLDILKLTIQNVNLFIQNGFNNFIYWRVTLALLFHISYVLLNNISNNITSLPYLQRSMLTYYWKKNPCFSNIINGTKYSHMKTLPTL